jgi:lysophospholipase L1-like esterase
MKPSCLALAGALALGACSASRAAEPAAIRVILVGDSTLAPNNGYGDALCQRFKPQVSCVNLAKNGRSSGSYRAEGLWQKVQALLAEPGAYQASYVLIEFGHNDQPGKPGRSTDLKTEFPANLARYVDEVRAAGATPVLVTPLTRRTFKDGVLANDLQPWADTARRVAGSQQVALIDLLAASAAAVQAMGQAEADTLAVAPPPAAAPAVPAAPTDLNRVEAVTPAKSAFDRTHVGPKGAQLFASMMAKLLPAGVPALAPYLRAEDSLP